MIAESIIAWTPVIASRMSGNLGMLGGSYPGYFPVGDPQALAAMMVRALQPEFLARLRSACRERKARFHPAAETHAVRGLVADLLR